MKVNRPDLQVRTRSGYYAESIARANPTSDTPASLEAVSRELLPERGLPMSITAAPFRGADGTPVVLVVTGVRASAGPMSTSRRGNEAGPPQFEPIEILSSAFRDGVKDIEWQRQRLSIALPETAPGQLRVRIGFDAAPEAGDYEVRVAARHEQADVVGSVHAFIEVPDFDAAAMSTSGMILVDSHAPTATPPQALAGILETAPTTRRDFTTADEVAALIRVYQRQRDKPGSVAVVFRVLNGAMREVTSSENALSADQFSGNGSADVRFTLPLRTLEPGAYVLRVDATGNGATSRRDVRFTVR